MSKLTRFTMVLASASILALGCKSKSEDEGKGGVQVGNELAPAAAPAEDSLMEEEEMMADDEYGGTGTRMAEMEGKMGRKESTRASGQYAMKSSPAPAKLAKRKSGEREKDSGVLGLLGGKGGGGAAEQGPAPRAWFPETFLFNPLVVTDDSGKAEVEVRVPDRLTDWRVLALAHSRNGAQAGTTTSFQGTLPAYVDPVVPSFLRVGDSVKIPIQLVNNTDEAMTTTLKVEVEGGSLQGDGQQAQILPRSSSLRYVTVGATQPGQIRLMARMGNRDMVVRSIPVEPTGKPVDSTKNGTLAAAREFSIVGAETRGASKGRARLAVFPGALALLRSELSAAMHRGTMASDAFALLLAGRAPALLKSLGDEADPEALRKMTIMSTQKVMKHARVLNVVSATLIAEAARSHEKNPVLERLGMRAISTIESGQSPDGTCGAQDGWTLQRLLVSTADCARAAHDSPNVAIRARGAFERNAKEIADPYTAAAILAAKGASGPLEARLRKLVMEAIKDSDNGAKHLSVPAGVLRADGRRPSTIEATALAILALAEAPDAPLNDLGATILANYSPRYGWGDGRSNLVCIQAAIQLFKDPIPEQVKILLSKDGEVVAEGELDRSKVREVLNIGAEGLEISGAHQWKVSADPAVPGLGFSLTLTSWVPWASADAGNGAELLVEVPGELQVGKAVLLPVAASVPGGMSFQIELALPAGAQVDRPVLDKLVQSGQLAKYDVAEGKVTLHARPLAAGKRLQASIRIIPTLGGSLQSGPATIRVGSKESYLPPKRWEIR